MKLIQFDFPHDGPFGRKLAEAMDGLARSIAEEPGLAWKIWTENEASGEAGGIYLFTDEDAARDYVARHTERLAEFGITGVNVKIFDINSELSEITRGPLTDES